jgi:hypothetical protein
MRERKAIFLEGALNILQDIDKHMADSDFLGETTWIISINSE